MAQDLGLSTAFGLEGAQQALRQRIFDQLAAEKQRQGFSLEQQRVNLLRQQVAGQEADRQAAIAERAQALKVTSAAAAAPRLMGVPIAETSFQGNFAGTPSEGLFAPASLSATQAIGGVPLPSGESSGNLGATAPSEPGSSFPAPPMSLRVAQRIPVPGASPNDLRFGTGTAEQQRTAADEAKQATFIGQLRMTNPAAASYLEAKGMFPQKENLAYEPFTQPGGPQTANAEDRRYENIVGRQVQNLPIAPDEAAFIKAYTQRKTLGTDTSAANALIRQEQQDVFQKQQAGRSELTNKVEQPYLDAMEKADTIRSVVAAAQGGNMIAGSVQPLLATLGVVTMEGVKRINSVELKTVAGAGSLLERIRSKAGGLSEGQPLSPALQADLVDLANKLEQSARKKYLQGHAQVKQRYQLTDEQPMAETAPAATDTSTLVNRLNARRQRTP